MQKFNPYHASIRTPKYRPRVVQDKKQLAKRRTCRQPIKL